VRAIGIFGGTFDPIHIGHLRPAIELREALGLEQVRMLPAAQPPHRQPPVASAEQRLALLQAAVEGVDGLVVDRRELERSGPSYMVDTLTSLREELPEQPLCLILGMDALLGLPEWHRWSELIGLAHLLVMRRPGSELPQSGAVAELVREHQLASSDGLHSIVAGGVWFSDVSQLDVSATRVREWLASGRSARYLLPDAVNEIVEARGIYRDASNV